MAKDAVQYKSATQQQLNPAVVTGTQNLNKSHFLPVLPSGATL